MFVPLYCEPGLRIYNWPTLQHNELSSVHCESVNMEKYIDTSKLYENAPYIIGGVVGVASAVYLLNKILNR